MTRPGPAILPDAAATAADSRAAVDLALQFIATWPDDRPFDAREILAVCPQIAECRSAVVELAYEEYCRHRDQGRELPPDSFARRFPEFLTAVRGQIALDGRVVTDPELYLKLNQDIAAAGWPGPGQSFLGFELVEELGRGAFSRVFRAREPDMGHREVVVKVARGGGGYEARAMGRLQHPRIVPVFSIQREEQSGLTATCMPWLGRATLQHLLEAACAQPTFPARAAFVSDLAARLNAEGETPARPQGEAGRRENAETRTEGEAETPETTKPRQRKFAICNLQFAIRNPFSRPPRPSPSSALLASRSLSLPGSYVDAVLRIGIDLAEALAFVHGLEVFHRDVKPSNVLLTAEGRALLFDFNLSFAQRLGAACMGGTPPYMPPEQLQAFLARDDAPPNGAAVDLFSLGVTLYQLLSGRLPFGPVDERQPVEGLAADLIERCRKPPLPLCEANPHVSRPLAALIEGCLAPCPEDRPPSAEALAAALRRQLAPGPRTRRWVRAHRRASLGILLSALAAGAAGAAAWAMRPSLAEQWIREGWQAHRQGDHAAALRHFQQALKEDASNAEALFGRGRAYLKSDEHQRAYEDFQRAAKSLTDGRAEACLGYVLQLMQQKDHAGAAQHYESALRRGFSSAGLYNNLGFCYLRQWQLARASRQLRKAIELAPTLQEARLHLVDADLLAATRNHRVPDLRLTHDAIALTFDDPWTYGRAVRVYTWAARYADSESDRQNYVDQALEYCERGLEMGLPPEILKRNAAVYLPLRQHERFLKLLETPRADVPIREIATVVDPLSGSTESPRF